MEYTLQKLGEKILKCTLRRLAENYQSFKPGLYDLALLDMRMPKMYGHELYDKMKRIDPKLKICFMTATYQNYEALRAAFPTIEIECYIQKPVEIKDLVRRINAELEQ